MGEILNKTRYLKFIENCKIKNAECTSKIMEYHHIEPKSIFPELAHISENIVALTPRQHFIAHWMLAKIYGGKMWFAFNMMKRVGRNSILYEYAREYIVEQIRNTNTNRPMSDKNKRKMSNLHKDTVMVMGEDGHIFRIHKSDPKYISGELKSYRYGYKHNHKTIDKMRSSNAINRGLLPFMNPISKEIKYFKEPTGEYTCGPETNEYKDLMSDLGYIGGKTIFVTLKSTGEQTRINLNNFDPILHTRERKKSGGFKGFEGINGSIRVYDIITKSYRLLITLDDIKESETVMKCSASQVKYSIDEEFIVISEKNIVKYEKLHSKKLDRMKNLDNFNYNGEKIWTIPY